MRVHKTKSALNVTILFIILCFSLIPSLALNTNDNAINESTDLKISKNIRISRPSIQNQDEGQKTVSVVNSKEMGMIQPDYIQSAPISITSDAQLIAAASSGNGTINDPYILSNLNITSTTGIQLFISSTTLYVEIRDNHFEGNNNAGQYGIYLNNVQHVKITNNSILNNQNNIRLVGADDVLIQFNNLSIAERNIYAFDMRSSTIRFNYLKSASIEHIYLSATTKITSSYNNLITRNVLDTGNGITFVKAYDVNVFKNTFNGSSATKISLSDSNDILISENKIQGGGIGINILSLSMNNVIEFNHFSIVSNPISVNEMNQVINGNELSDVVGVGIEVKNLNVTINNNKLWGNGSASSIGIRFDFNEVSPTAYNRFDGFLVGIEITSTTAAPGAWNIEYNDFINCGTTVTDDSLFGQSFKYNYYDDHTNIDSDKNYIADSPYTISGSSSDGYPMAYPNVPLSGKRFSYPIYIDSNAALAAAADHGTGTFSDPYVIEGKNITQSSNRAIEIKNTNMYLVIRYNYIDNVDNSNDSIVLTFVTNAKIVDNEIKNSADGFDVYGLSIVQISRNWIYSYSGAAIYVKYSNNLVINETIFSAGGNYNVWIANSNYITVEQNRFTTSIQYPLYVQASDNCGIKFNEFYDKSSGNAAQFFAANNNTISNNYFYGLGNALVLTNGANDNTIMGNTFSDNIKAITVNGYDAIIWQNTIEYSLTAAIHVFGGPFSANNAIIEDNYIQFNGGDALLIDRADDAIVVNNAIRNNSGNGVRITGANSWALLENNTFSYNNIGVIIDDTATNATIRNNDFIDLQTSFVTNNLISPTALVIERNFYSSLDPWTDVNKDGFVDSPPYYTNGGTIVADTLPRTHPIAPKTQFDNWSPNIFTHPPSTYNYTEGSTGHYFIYQALDDNPERRFVFLNGSLQDVGFWFNYVNYTVNADGLAFGVYNLTVVFRDDGGYASRWVTIVSVLDDTAPVFTSIPSNVTIGYVSTGNEISWTVDEAYKEVYHIYVNNSIYVGNVTWTTDTISLNIDFLPYGTTPVKLVVVDKSGNSANHTVNVLVEDQSPPSVSDELDADVLQNTQYDITWTVSDYNPGFYDILVDGAYKKTGYPWVNGTITYKFNTTSEFTTYNVTLVLRDTKGYISIDSVFITTIEEDIPEVIPQADVNMDEFDTNVTVLWPVADVHPDYYDVYLDETWQVTNSWSNGTIGFDLDGLGIGSHNLTVIVYDTFGNYAIDLVWVLVTDSTAPSITGPGDYSYDYGQIFNSLTWQVTDNNPDVYNVTIDGGEYSNALFIADTLWSGDISFSVDGLMDGVYTLTIYVFDDGGNSASDSITLTVKDITSPDVSSPADISFNTGETGYQISWDIGDRNLNAYYIYQDDILMTWTSTANITVNYSLDGLGYGFYNFTIYANDTEGNFATDTVFVTVNDFIPPEVDSPADVNIEYGSTSNSVTWIVGDQNPYRYNITIDGSLMITNADWTNGSISYPIDGLSLGSHTVIISLIDIAGWISTDSVTVTVEDTINPTLTTEPTDQSYEFGSKPTLDVDWIVSDLNAKDYICYQNGTEIKTAAWISDNALTINVGDFAIGVHNVTIIFYDISGNSVVSTIYVTVEDTTNPIFTTEPTNQGYEYGSTPTLNIDWTATDLDAFDYLYYKNGLLMPSGSWTSGAAVTIDLGGFALGVHNVTLVFRDGSGNSVISTIFVTVVDTTAPTESYSVADFAYEHGTSSYVVTWNINDLDAAVWSYWLDGVEQVSNNPWSSGNDVNYDFGGFDVGVYNITAIFYDGSGNYFKDVIFCKVEDTTAPEITSPIDISYTQGTTGHTVTWDIGDINIDYFDFEIDGVDQLGQTSTASNYTVVKNVDSWARGVYNYTILVFDIYGNMAWDSVIITVTDDTDPVIDNPTDFSYTLGTTGHSITWTAGDQNPDYYDIFVDASPIVSGTSWSNGTITYLVDGLSLGPHTISIYVYDVDGAFITDTVTITVLDASQPIVDSPADTGYSEGTVSSFIVWTNAGDKNPDVYSAYANGTAIVSNQGWVNGSIAVDVGGLAYGIYNITLILWDDASNFVTDLVWLTVTDDVAPLVTTPSDYNYEEGSTGHSVSWTATDLHASYYRIFLSGTQIVEDNWDTAIQFSLNLDSYTLGTYIFTLYVFDMSNNSITDTVVLSVVDTVSPSVLDTSDTTITETSTGNTISWTATDTNAGTYTIYKDSSPIDSGSWTSGLAITFDIDGLGLGVFTYQITFYDTSSNSASDTVIVTVYDGTSPTIDTPINFEYPEGSTGNSITWNVYDLHPDTYSVTIDASSYLTDVAWSGSSITIDIDGLVMANHSIIITVYDQTGNSVSDQVYVNVFDSTIPVIDNPADISYEVGTITNYVIWTASDNLPDVYNVYDNGVMIRTSVAWASGAVAVNLGGLDWGTHNITIVLLDEAGNSISDLIWVKVYETDIPDASMPAIVGYTEGTGPHTFTLTVGDEHPNGFNVTANGVLIHSWTSYTNGTYVIDYAGLTAGDQTILVKVYDIDWNLKTLSVTITIEADQSPTIDSPGNKTYNEGRDAYYIYFTMHDTNPDLMWVYINGTPYYGNVPWTDGATIQLDVGHRTYGIYNVTMYITDTTGNYAKDTVWITVKDITNPDATGVADLTYDEGSTGNTITFGYGDKYLDYYIIYQDGVDVSGMVSVSTNGTVDWNVDGLIVGQYFFTIEVYDKQGNSSSVYLVVTVEDNQVPDLQYQVPDYTYVHQTTGHSISYTLIENYPDVYYTQMDGVNYTLPSSYIDGNVYSTSIDGLSVGQHVLTVIVHDIHGNFATFNIDITVVADTTIPDIAGPADQTIELGQNTTLSFIAGDWFPDTYSVWVDGNAYDSGTWTNSSGISVELGSELYIGSHTIQVIVLDTSGNENSVSVTLTIEDTIAPVGNMLSTYSFKHGEVASINIIGTDLDPDTFVWYINGTEQIGASWFSNQEFTLSFSLEIGYYNLTLVLFDVTGNKYTKTAWVTIYDGQIDYIGADYELRINPGESISLMFNATDSNQNNFSINIDGVMILYGDWDWSYYEYSFNYTIIGTYEVTLVVWDVQGNTDSMTVTVVVADTIPPVVIAGDDVSFVYYYDVGTFLATFNVTEEYFGTYAILINGTSVLTETMTSSYITHDVSGFAPGTYNITLVAIDQYGNTGSDFLFVFVTTYEQDEPVVDPSDPANENIVYGAGSTLTLTWSVEEQYPDYYNVYINDVIAFTGNLSGSALALNAISITYEFTAPAKGEFEIYLEVFDVWGYSSTSDVFTIEVLDSLDVLAPDLTSQNSIIITADMEYTITWQVEDDAPDAYQFILDDDEGNFVSWDGSAISFKISGLSVGQHTLTLKVINDDGYAAEDTIIITVVEAKPTVAEDAPGFGFFIAILAMIGLIIPLRRRKL
ncbi:MAG: right-handed parallel beta-helix repeat-containing protein [Candidatus Heimdallarchaeota archaeon]|nr:right-handed parallel beta-helix repeat-containing protein [Candidatus Heimdallarchaeota archaeon]